MIITKIFFYFSSFIIFWGLIGYPFSLKFINLFYRKKKLKKLFFFPTVTLMIVAHNEEKVILQKLNNAINLKYPIGKIEILVSSDNSTDNTNTIVKNFISTHPKFNIRLYEVKERKGKTNAQNEAQKTTNSEILVMTDANSILKEDAIVELVSAFTDDDIGYVCGKLIYVNNLNHVANKENNYWERDLQLRQIESNIKTITAGNGAIYACRNSLYKDIPLIESHDSSMPRYLALDKKRALYNADAIAYEKAGENIGDEFARKVRMNRNILKNILPSIKILNFFKYGWYTYFYLGHRTARYLLWISHFIVFFTSGILAFNNFVFFLIFLFQILFYLLALFAYIFKANNKFINYIYYYTITILAQWLGVVKIITGKSKPFWEKAESTR